MHSGMNVECWCKCEGELSVPSSCLLQHTSVAMFFQGRWQTRQAGTAMAPF